MRMNHINLSVPNFQETRDFFEKYFGLKFFGAQNQKIAVALDENDCLIALNSFGPGQAANYPAAFHVGFNLPSRDDVDTLHERLAADGYKVGRRTEFHGAWTFYMEAPGSFTVEIFHQAGMEQIKQLRGQASSEQ